MENENCHMCGAYADGGECPFQAEMNPDENPVACCDDCQEECFGDI